VTSAPNLSMNKSIDRLLFWAILIVAAALRIFAALPESMHHADEVGQYTEQAFRLVFGYGAVPWEYRYGMRSWLLPILLSGPMSLGQMIAPETKLYLLLPKLCVSIASLSVPVSAYFLGKRLSCTHALVAMAVSAIWFELIFFGTHILSEPLAVAAILPAIALLSNPQASVPRLVFAGALLAIATLFRFHYVVPIFILVIGYCWRAPKARLSPVVMGGLAIAAVSAAVDIAMGSIPFSWFFFNIYQNIIVNRSAGYGVSPPSAYLVEMNLWWGIGALPIVLAIVAGYKQHRLLIWAAIINLGLHSAIGHKEYRFIFLSLTIFVIVAACGSVNIIDWLRTRMPKKIGLAVPALVLMMWGGLSATQANTPTMATRWIDFGASQRMMRALGKDGSVCGLGIDDRLFWEFGAYSALKRNIPIYPVVAKGPVSSISQLPDKGVRGFNMVVGNQALRSRLPQTYVMKNCELLVSGRQSADNAQEEVRICEFRRAGGCDGRGMKQFQVNEILRANEN
jgi:GPI mannosyltransferase 3